MIRGLFYRGRHHVRTAPRPADGGLVTVSTIAARIRREEADRTVGSYSLTFDVDVAGLSAGVRRALLGSYESPEVHA